MITLYAFGKVTPEVIGITRDLRALWALEESGLQYEIHGLDDIAGELHRAEYLAINPFGKVPAIHHDGVVIFESGAILAYLAEQSGQLMPERSEDRTKVLQWAFAAVDTIEPALTEIASIDLFHADATWALQRRSILVAMAQDRLAVLEDLFGAQSYICGEHFSYPDILVTTALHQVQHTDLLDPFQNVGLYLDRCALRPAWRVALGAYEKRLAG